jgi:hypothetical protein
MSGRAFCRSAFDFYRRTTYDPSWIPNNRENIVAHLQFFVNAPTFARAHFEIVVIFPQ